MEITDLINKIYNDKPKPACSQQISIYEGNSINEQFEIISLIILEGIERKLIKDLDKQEDKKKYIQRVIILLKLYLSSIGVKLNINFLTKKEIKNLKLSRSVNFWVIKKFNFDVNCLYRYIKKGKEKTLYYNTKSKLNHFREGFLIVKIQNFILKISFKEY